VIWIHYSRPRNFSKNDEDVLVAYLTQATIAYDNARQREELAALASDYSRQMEELKPLRFATEGVEAAGTIDEVLTQIVVSARHSLRADYVIAWSYNDTEAGASQFLPVREAVVDGVDEALRNEVLDKAIPIGEVTRSVLKEGWLGFSDIDESTGVPLPNVSRQLLQRLGAKSLGGLAIADGFGKQAILYLVYKDRREFRTHEEAQARTFANYAANALRQFKLVDQITKAHRAARKVTEVMTLGDLNETLKRIVRNTREVLNCDAVTLFIYNEEMDRILPLTTMDGVWHEQAATHCEDAPRDSIVYRMLKKDEPFCVPDAPSHELFKGRAFIEREAIVSVCAIPLKVRDVRKDRDDRVGVMFVNYRKTHNFNKEEEDIIVLFANQAAIAIRNNLLYEEQSKRLSE
jgi:GAF domain-containing protein